MTSVRDSTEWLSPSGSSGGDEDDALSGLTDGSWNASASGNGAASGRAPAGGAHHKRVGSAGSGATAATVPSAYSTRDAARSHRMGAAGHEILSSSGSHAVSPPTVPPIAPAPLRMHTPLAGPSLFVDSNDEFVPPQSVSTPSISDKLRSLKLKSRAGRTPSAASAANMFPPPPASSSSGSTNAFPMPHQAPNSRAASAFVRRPQHSHHQGPGADELDDIIDGYDTTAGGGSYGLPPRPASNMSHYSSNVSHQSAMGSQTPSASAVVRNPFGGGAGGGGGYDSSEPPSTNSSYDPAQQGGTSSSGQASAGGPRGPRRRNAPQSASIVSTATTVRGSALGSNTDSASGFYSSSSAYYPTPSSPSSTNSSFSYSNNPSVHSSLSTIGGGGVGEGLGGRAYSSLSPQPDSMDRAGQQGLEKTPQPSRRPRFTSEPPAPPGHLQNQPTHYSPPMPNGGGGGGGATPFGAERARAAAAAAGGGGHNVPAGASSYHHTHHNSISVRPTSSAVSHSAGGGHHPHTPSTTSFSAHYASLMDESEERERDALSPTPYSSAFDDREFTGSAPHTRVHSQHSQFRPSISHHQGPQAHDSPSSSPIMPARTHKYSISVSRNPSHSSNNSGNGAGRHSPSASPLPQHRDLSYLSADERPLGGSGSGQGGSGSANPFGSRAHGTKSPSSSKMSPGPAVRHPAGDSGSSWDLDSPAETDNIVSSQQAPNRAMASSPNPATPSHASMQHTAAASASVAAAVSSKESSKWDLTPAQAAAMGMDFSLPPSGGGALASTAPTSFASSLEGRKPPSASSAPRGKQPVRAKPVVSIPPPTPLDRSQPHSASVYSSATSSATPTAASPARLRNPRMGSVSSPGGPPRLSSGDPLGSPSSASGSGDDSQYIKSADLAPFPSPSAEVGPMLKGLQSSDWFVRFDAITSLRRLVVHHPDLVANHTKALVRDLKSEVNSLRSSLAKNGLMALSDIFAHLPRGAGWEGELDNIGPSMLKRAGEPSGFLREEAHRSLLAMIAHCSDKYTLPLLLNQASTGTKLVKTMSAVYLDRALELYASRPGGGAALQNNKEWPRVLKCLGSFSSDAAAESRQHSKWALIRLAKSIGLDTLDRSLQKTLPPAHYHAVGKVLGKGLDNLVLELTASMRERDALGGASGSSPPAAEGQRPMLSPTASMRNRSLSSATSALAAAGAQDALGDDNGTSSISSNRGAGGMGSRRMPSASPSRGPTASPTDATDRGGGNMFDLDNPEYNNASPAGAASVSSSGGAAPAGTGTRAATSKRRPTMSASSAGGGGGGSGGGSVLPPPSAADAASLASVLAELASPDWRTRMTSLDKLVAILASSPSAGAHAAPRVFDALAQRVVDHHGKVNVAALQVLPSLLPHTKAYLPNVLSSFVPCLASQLASTNPLIRQLSQSGLESLARVIQTPLSSFGREAQASLLAPLAQAALFENVKARPLVLSLLTQVLESCADAAAESNSLPSLTTFKSVVPVAYSLVDESRSEVRAPLQRTASMLYTLVGNGLWEEKILMQFHIAPQQVTKLRSMLNV